MSRVKQARTLLCIFGALATGSLYAFQDDATTLTRGSVLERTLSGGESHSYRLALAAGESANLAVEQRGIDVTVQALDSSGKVVAVFNTETRRQGLEPVVLAADAQATWELRVRAAYPREPAGRYEVRVLSIGGATEDDRAAFGAHRLAYEGQQRVDAGNYDEALQLYRRAVEAQEKASGPDNAYVAILLTNQGLLERRKGEYAKAAQTYQRAVEISEKLQGRESPLCAVALRGLGSLYTLIGEYAKAEPLLQEQVAIMEKTLGGEHPAMVGALGELAQLHQFREDLQRAIAEREHSLAIAEKTLDPNDYQLMAAMGNLGDLYSVAGDNGRAEPMLERTLAMAERIYGPDHPYVSTVLQNLGIIFRETKRYQRALEYFERAETIRVKAVGLRNPQTATLLINIGNLHHDLREFSKSLELQQQALEILTAVAGPYHRWTLMALSNAGRDYAALGDLPHAIEYRTRDAEAMEQDIRLHLAIGSEREKLIYLNNAAFDVARALSLHAAEAPNDRRARELGALVLLRHKGRVLDAMSGSLAALRDRLNADDRKLLDELSAANSKLANLALGGPGKTPPDEYRKQIAAIEEAREKLESTASRRSAEFRAQTQPVTLAAIRAAIPAEAALIEFASYRPYDPRVENGSEFSEQRRYIAYILRREGDVRWQEMGDAGVIDQAVEEFRSALRDPRRQDVRTLARAADKKILEPLRPLLGDATRLLISPDGSLNLIPFEALIDEQGRYQVNRYAIHYLTTGRDLLRLQVARGSRSGPVVVADPQFGDPGGSQPKLISQASRRSITSGADLSRVYFAPLGGTAEEADAIRKLFPDARVLAGRQATKAALQAVDAPVILHIATHGFFLDDSPPAGDPAGTRGMQAKVKIENPLLRSGLALAGANLNPGHGDDGILTALEASTLNLWGTKVVTLSACETGVGEVKRGEGVYGLRRAFFLGGTETLVMSLWPVSDRVTRQMMIAYYTGLKNGLGRGDALRQAQREMLKHPERRHPFYWAAFIQSGEWKNLEGK